MTGREPAETFEFPPFGRGEEWPDRTTADVAKGSRTVVEAERASAALLWSWGGYLVVLLAAGLWVAAIRRTDLSTVSGYGLVATADWTYPAALVVTLGGAVVELAAPRVRPALMAAYVVLLVLILHATVPLLAQEPEYDWTYKHVGVIQFIEQAGQLTDKNDIYQQWPAFFAGAAQLSAVTGVQPMDLAEWEPVFTNLAYCLLLLAIFRTLTTSGRLPILAVLVSQCANWTGQYLSPQDFAYILTLGILLAVLTFLAVAERPAAGRTGPLAARVRSRWRACSAAVAPTTDRRTRWGVLVGIHAIFAVLTAAHQLSPYLLVLDLAVLGSVGLIRPRYLALTLGCIAVAYLLPRLPFIASSYGLVSGANPVANGAGNVHSWGSPEQAFSARAVRALAFGMWGSALLGVLLLRRSAERIGLAGLLTFAPFSVLLLQNYGGEAIYRVYLFSVPWAAFILASLLTRLRWRPVAWAAGVGALLTVMAGATIQGQHGQLVVDRVTRSEVAASEYFYRHAASGSTLLLAVGSYPIKFTADYAAYNVSGGQPLLDGMPFLRHRLGERDLPAVDAYARSQGRRPCYLVVSRGMADYTHYFGYLPDGSIEGLDRALARSPHWTPFYRGADTSIYQFVA